MVPDERCQRCALLNDSPVNCRTIAKRVVHDALAV